MQLALYGEAGRAREAGEPGRVSREESARKASVARVRMCAACRAHEARYGFRDEDRDDPAVGRPKTLCFDCFRMELDRRQTVAAQLARGWNATQADLPLAGTLDALTRRRRRAQIAARHALELR